PQLFIASAKSGRSTSARSKHSSASSRRSSAVSTIPLVLRLSASSWPMFSMARLASASRRRPCLASASPRSRAVTAVSSFAILHEVLPEGRPPRLAAEVARAPMDDGDGPRSHEQAAQLRLPAEVHVIEVEGKARIEAQLAFDQRVATHGEEHAVEQRDLLTRRPVNAELDQIGEPFPVSDHAAQVLVTVAGE